jgi:hypothetical protein
MRCLAQELNVTLEESSFDTMVYSRGRWGRGSVNSLLNTDGRSGYTADISLSFACTYSKQHPQGPMGDMPP